MARHQEESSFLTELARARDENDTNLRRSAKRIGEIEESARACERNLLKFVFHWKALYRFYLLDFDLDSAGRVVKRAIRLRLREAKAYRAQFRKIADNVAPLRGLISSARENLVAHARDGAGEMADDALILFVTYKLMAVAGKPAHIDFHLLEIYSNIVALLNEHGIKYTPYLQNFTNCPPEIDGERKYLSHHTFSEARNGLHFKVTDRRGYYSVDRGGFAGFSCFANIGQQEVEAVGEIEAQAQYERDLKVYVEGNLSKKKQPAVAEVSTTGKPWIFVALQKSSDITQTLADVPMLDMLHEVAATGRKRGIEVVVKRHPGCKDERVAEALREGVGNRRFRVSEASIHSLIAGSCAVCVVNSSVGAEALLHMKPVYLFGRSEYQYACHRMRASGEFDRMFAPDELPMAPKEIMKFLFLLRREFSFDVREPDFPEFLERKLLDLVHAD